MDTGNVCEGLAVVQFGGGQWEEGKKESKEERYFFFSGLLIKLQGLWMTDNLQDPLPDPLLFYVCYYNRDTDIPSQATSAAHVNTFI